jgi:hypothetical protein
MMRFFLGVSFALFCGVSVGSAVTLDWSTVTWTAGSLSNSYQVDPNFSGNNITISVTDSSGALTGSGTPNIPSYSSSPLGGTGKPSLQMAPTFLLGTQSITVTISFNTSNYPNGVYVNNLNILGVDSNNSPRYTDSITNIQGVTATNQTINAVAVAGGSSVTVSGNSSTGWTATGKNSVSGTSANGNVSVSFGNSRVKQISFTLSNTNAVLGGRQLIGLDNITYSLTPEVQPGIIGAAICGFVLMYEFGRNRRKKREPKGTLAAE